MAKRDRRGDDRSRLALHVDLFAEERLLGRFRTRDLAARGMFVESVPARVLPAGAPLQAVLLLEHVAANWVVVPAHVARVARDGLGLRFGNEYASVIANLVYRLTGDCAAYEAAAAWPLHDARTVDSRRA